MSRVGTAYIQELRFNRYCERLQSLVQDMFDQEFKRYLHKRGVNIDSALFELKFQPPQNFASYRQAELDTQRISTFAQLSQVPFMSKRFALKRFLGMNEEEIAENERLWAEENGKANPIPTDSSAEMRGAGVSQAGLSADMGALADQPVPPEMAPAEATPAAAVPGAGAAPAAPAAPPAA